MKLFNFDSPLMQALSKIADMLWLNVLALICCIPIVTVGASMTSLHYMALKMARNEETYVTKGFFKSFRENFRQATIIWLMQLVVILVILADLYIMYSSENPPHIVIQVLVMLVLIIFLCISTFVYPLLARFYNTLWGTIKNALFFSIMQFPKTVLMVIMSVLPIVIVLYAPVFIPIALLFGLSVPAYLFAKLYSKFFKKLEAKALSDNPPPENPADADEEDKRIFRDELDTTLANHSNDR